MATQPQDIAPSRFFTLPAEIRDEIYSLLLHHSLARRELPDDFVEYKYDLRLFRVNRQFYHESRAVFRRLNTFVLIETPWPEAESHISEEGRVPIIASSPHADKFDNVYMHVTIEAYQYRFGEGDMHKIMILLEDLPAFCKMWYYSDLSHPGLNPHLDLILTLQDPSAHQGEKKEIPKSIQKRLLEPFGEIKNLHETRIEGEHDETLAKDLRARQSIPYKSPGECLEEATKLKDAGNAALQKQQYIEALRLYEAAFLAIHIVVSGQRRNIWGNAYFETIIQSGQYSGQNAQIVRLVLRVKLVANICQAYLKLEQYEEVKFWGMRSIRIMRESVGIEDDNDDEEPVFGFEAADQMGKIYYRTGLAFRETDDKAQARKLLRVAHRYLPRSDDVGRALASVALRI